MRMLFYLVLAICVAVVWSSFAWRFGLELWTPHLAVVFTVYAAARMGIFEAVLTAFVLGLCIAVMSDAPAGATLLSLLPVIPYARWARRVFPTGHFWALALACIPAALLADAVFALLVFVVQPGTVVFASLLRTVPPSTLLTAIVAMPVMLGLLLLEPAATRTRKPDLS